MGHFNLGRLADRKIAGETHRVVTEQRAHLSGKASYVLMPKLYDKQQVIRNQLRKRSIIIEMTNDQNYHTTIRQSCRKFAVMNILHSSSFATHKA